MEQEEFDQVQNAIQMLKTDPMSRRIVVSTWHLAYYLKWHYRMPCHVYF